MATPAVEGSPAVAELKSAAARELKSFQKPPQKEVAPVPKIGVKAPVSAQLNLPHDKPTVIVFLRNCGDPFAEKTFRLLTKFSTKHPEIHCIAVSHSPQPDTDAWVVEVGGEWDVEVVADPERDLYSSWGLGTSSTWHALNPWSLYSAYRLGKDEGIWNTSTQGGTRWQMSGCFAVDAEGYVRFAQVARAADYIPDFKGDVLKALDGVRKGLP